jgi:lactate permease
VVFVRAWPSVKVSLDGGSREEPNALRGWSRLSFEIPYLHARIYRAAPVVAAAPDAPDGRRAALPEPAVYELNWLSTTGTGIFLAACLTALFLRISPRVCGRQFFECVGEMRWALFTVACMLALAFVTKYGGADATLGLLFTRTGPLYPVFAPILGWLGVAITGSDTSSNALFGSLQRITAEQLGLDPVLIAASNSTGGVMGKMVNAQSIVVAAVSTKQQGSEGAILRGVFLHSIVLAFLVGFLTLAQAHFLRWMVP